MKRTSNATDSAWRPHDDFSETRTRRRQHFVTVALVEAGRNDLLFAAAGEIRLPSSVCQIQARDDRVGIERAAYDPLAGLQRRGAILIFVTAIVPVDAAQSRPFGESPNLAGERFTWALRSRDEILAAVGLLDTAYTTGRGSPHWDPHFHAVVAVEASSIDDAKAIIRGALGEWTDVQSEPVTDLAGALRYVGKTLCLNAIVRRTLWKSKGEAKARWKSKKRALQLEQRKQLVRQVLGLKTLDRLATVGFERRLSLNVSSDFEQRTEGFFARSAAKRRAARHQR